jgi:hypothetical protein
MRHHKSGDVRENYTMQSSEPGIIVMLIVSHTDLMSVWQYFPHPLAPSPIGSEGTRASGGGEGVLAGLVSDWYQICGVVSGIFRGNQFEEGQHVAEPG